MKGTCNGCELEALYPGYPFLHEEGCLRNLPPIGMVFPTGGNMDVPGLNTAVVAITVPYRLKTAKIRLDSIKDPDGWGELIHELGLTTDEADRFFEFHEYADVELTVGWNGQELGIYGGRIVPKGE